MFRKSVLGLKLIALIETMVMSSTNLYPDPTPCKSRSDLDPICLLLGETVSSHFNRTEEGEEMMRTRLAGSVGGKG